MSGPWAGANLPFCNPRDPADCEACLDNVGCDKTQLSVRNDGTVASSCCGLTWQQSTGPEVTWQEASAYCSGLTLAGGGFRLPSFGELYSLRKAGATPSIDSSVFPGLSTTPVYWSATESTDEGEAWFLDFATGRPGDGRVSARNDVRCVK